MINLMSPRYKIFAIAREFFQGFLLLYMIFTVAEIIKPGIVINFFNLNYILIAVLVSGITMVMSDKSKSKE